ncbi:unnamed protein product [Lactuca saligna]|uniref:RelA/SpoT domain-containing protein n=1 Tax=Lactuca saligna TaxID=75948 RepID=A0AA35YV93_LACSI|nr:unnamed protein product [Lactuca saligna]
MGRGIAEEALVLLRKRLSDLHFIFSLFSYCPDSNYSYALPSGKAKAVAQDTLVIWCSLASRLGHWALKAELEDLCFAVLQPQIFQQMRSDLASLWTPSSSSTRVGNLRRLSAKSSSNPEYEASTEDVVVSMKDLLQAVIPFDLLLDRRKRIKYIQDLGSCSEVQTKPKVVRDVGIALASLVVCEEELERELFISTSYVPGMEVTLSSRLKSLYSIYSKMDRKDVSIDKVYDARALRVIVGDKSGTLHGQTVECCYSLLNIIHKLWTPIDGEFDDYIVNPKSGGYQCMYLPRGGRMNSDVNVSPGVVAISVLVILLIRFFTGHKKDDKDQVEFIAGKTSLGDAVDGAIKIFTIAECHDCCCCGSRRTSISCHINAGILDAKNDVG